MWLALSVCSGGSGLVREGFLKEVALERDLRPGGHLLEHLSKLMLTVLEMLSL